MPAWPCAWTDVWAREVAPDGHSAAPPAPARSRTHPHSPALTHTHLHAGMTVRTDCRLTGPVSGMFYAIVSPTRIFFSFLSRRQLTSGSGGRKRQACSSADKLAADLPAAPVPAFPTGPRTRRVLRGQGPPRSGRQHTPPLLTEAEPRARFLCATPGRGAGQDAFAQRPGSPLDSGPNPACQSAACDPRPSRAGIPVPTSCGARDHAGGKGGRRSWGEPGVSCPAAPQAPRARAAGSLVTLPRCL